MKTFPRISRIKKSTRRPVSKSIAGKISNTFASLSNPRINIWREVGFVVQVFSLFVLTVVFFSFFYLVVEPDNRAKAGEFEKIEILSHFYDQPSNQFLEEKTIIVDNKPLQEQETTLLTYIVKPGESLSKISLKLGIEIEDVKSLNSLVAPYSLSVGQALKYPSR